MPNFGVRTGFVWRGERQLVQPLQRQPAVHRLHRAGDDPGPGSGRRPRQRRRWRVDSPATTWRLGARPAGGERARTTSTAPTPTTTPGRSPPPSACTRRWSMLAAFSKTWNQAQNGCGSSACGTRATFFGTQFRRTCAVTPNNLINTEPDGKINYTDWSLKLHGTLEVPYGLKVSPMLRHQGGQNFGRTILAHAELRHRAHSGRAARHPPSGQHQRLRLPRREDHQPVVDGEDRSVPGRLQRLQRQPANRTSTGRPATFLPPADRHRAASRASRRRQGELVVNAGHGDNGIGTMSHSHRGSLNCAAAIVTGACCLRAGWLSTNVGRRGRTASATPTPSRRASASGPPATPRFTPDMTRITSPDLQKVFAYIDEHVDEHVENLQKWIQQPSISNSGEGIPESAEMVKGFFEQLGCQESRVYDVGKTEWGSQGNPVVYAQVRRRRAANAGHLLDVRHDAGDAAGRVDRAAVRRPAGRAGAVQEGADRPRRHQLQGTADGPVERADVDQGGHRQAAGQPDLRRRRRRRADVDRLPPVRQGPSRSCSRTPTRCIASAARASAAAASSPAARKAASTSS